MRDRARTTCPVGKGAGSDVARGRGEGLAYSKYDANVGLCGGGIAASDDARAGYYASADSDAERQEAREALGADGGADERCGEAEAGGAIDEPGALYIARITSICPTETTRSGAR